MDWYDIAARESCDECKGLGELRVGYFLNHEEFVRTGPNVPCPKCSVRARAALEGR